MRKIIVIALFLSVLLASPLAESQAQQASSQTYSMLDRFIDEIRMVFTYGDDRINLNLEIREKEINSAIANAKNENINEALRNLNNAEKRLKAVQETVSLDMVEEVRKSVEKTVGRINNETDLPEEFDEYIMEERRTQLTAELTHEIFLFCKELAAEDYALMLREEKCNPQTAPSGLQGELKELKNIQEESFNRLMLDIRSCIDVPGTCNCEDVSDAAEKARCQKMVALALKCEYTEDEEACSELDSMKPVAESFVPDFLMNLFGQKSGMIDYDIEKSDVPPECYNQNTKPECAQYSGQKEGNSKCWDEEGNFLEDECGGSADREPTMQESIPQCYGENDEFLFEKCGKITIVRNEEGLINYIIGKEVEMLIEGFENESAQHRVDVNGTIGQTQIEIIEERIREGDSSSGEETAGNHGGKNETWIVDEGTQGSGDGGLAPEIKTSEGTGDDGLTPEVKTTVNSGEGSGDGGLIPEVKTTVD
jgi:hypothetical protein